jgi:8-oxo-dGTP pyrophosphatase MutT (NUDIX family)
MKEVSFGVCFYKIENSSIYILMNKTNSKSSFNFFKGKKEEGENNIDTAIREIKEETNIDIKLENLETYFFEINKRKNIGIFIVDWNNLKIKKVIYQKEEIYSVDWVNITNHNIEISKNQYKLYLNITSYLSQKLCNFKKVYLNIQ